MSGIRKKIADIGRRAFGRVTMATSKAAGSAAKQGVKSTAEALRDPKTSAEWLVRVLTRLPKILRMYFSLLTDNRVSSKVKVFLVAAVATLGSNFAFGGILLGIQTFLSHLIGPLAFLPTILILLLTLDYCYKLIDAEVLEEHETTVFGEAGSLQSDIQHLRDYLGSSYNTFKNWWEKKAVKLEAQMQKDGHIVNGDLTETAIQDVSDQIVELEMSVELRKEIDKNVKLLTRDTTVSGVFKALEREYSQ